MDEFDLSWMAWTQPTATFFGVILLLIIGMSIWEYFSPGGNPRVGILRFETTRGDRLFLSLLASAFVHLGWLATTTADLWWATGLSGIVAVLIFMYV